MFWPSKMHRVTLGVPQKHKQELVLELHRAGICQLVDSEHVPCAEDKIPSLELRINNLVHELRSYKKPKAPEKSVASLFSPKKTKKPRAELRQTSEIVNDVEKELTKLENPIQEKLDQMNSNKKEVDKIQKVLYNLSLLPDLSLDSLQSTSKLKRIIGLVTDVSHVKQSLKHIVYVSREVTPQKHFIALFFQPEQESKVVQVLHEVGFEDIDVPFGSGKPNDVIKKLENELRQLEQKKRRIREDLMNLNEKECSKLIILSKELSICRERADAIVGMHGGQKFCVLNAWVPEKNLVSFKKIVNKVSGAHFMELAQNENAPTLLNNPWFIQPFEMITNLYSLPKYDSLDPTPVLALSFAFFFGFMLTDFVYGALLTLIAFVLYTRPGVTKGMKGFCFVLMVSGLFTAMLGAVFGSYLGDLFQKLGFQVPALLDPMRDIMILIVISVGIGILHLITAFVLGIIDNVKKKQYREALSGQVVWLLFLAGGGCAALGPMEIGVGLILSSVLMKMVLVFLKDGPVSAMLSVFDFSGFIGDMFSYARLMAMAVGTAGVALAINFIGLLLVDLLPGIGIAFAAVILFIGHLFNMCMNGLGAFVHTVRLHFLEFFTKFYSGGGKEYKPFHATKLR